jgi:hypothetical protein
MALGLKRLDMLVGVERDCPLRPAMETPVALLVAYDTISCHGSAWDPMLWHTALGVDIDLNDLAGIGARLHRHSSRAS